ncbi:hypothetical protein [Deinococcus maricopensis]|uniref:Uncharacterized protein n=1 Tax=Deinococcus maricopensis (strain DSM 21211 / LMG 22137 / NRRL B-23946 / LB-34) TaxID=709986 RepID=E8UC01_DEIML|nr:hypothetical protein [Deinococcus maricopensis]ADV68590.1 hypothetical protein Deima_2961 [Deinococcus maricopensis DSM 21211]
MNADTYIRRATLTLTGRARRDAATELRGAIDDKLHRYALLGLNEHDALTRTLADLGDPRALSAQYAHVHTLPAVTRALALGALLTATTLTLGAVAQNTVLHPVPYQNQNIDCDYSDAALAQRPAAEAARIRAAFQQQGGRATVEATCRTYREHSHQYLRFTDVTRALHATGLHIQQDATSLTIQNATVAAERFGDEAYLHTDALIFALLNGTDLPISISGDRTPTLQVGQATLVLGTPDAPVFTSDLYSMAISTTLQRALQAAGLDAAAHFTTANDEGAMGAPPRLQVQTPKDGQYVVITAYAQATPVCHCTFTARVRTARSKQFTLLSGPTATQPHRVVSTFTDLVRAQRAGQQALLVLQLNPSSDLRTVISTAADYPLPAAQVKLSVQPAPQRPA